MIIKITEEEFKKWYSKEWEKSVIITHWEHNFEEHNYIIKYEDKQVKH